VLTRLGGADLLAEALALHDDYQLNQAQQLRSMEVSKLPSVSSSSSSSSGSGGGMLEVVAQNVGVSMSTLCAGISDVFTLFCAVYAHQLAATDDEELFTASHSMSNADLQSLVAVLKKHLYKLFVSSYLAPDVDRAASSSSNTPMLTRNKILLGRLFKQVTLAKLYGALYARSERRPFLPQQFWQWNGITALAPDYRQRVRDLEHSRNPDGQLDMTTLLSTPNMKPLLTCLPQMIPFSQRIELLQTLIAADRARSSDRHNYHAFNHSTRVRVRRDYILEDTVNSLSVVSTASLKGRVQVEFVSGVGGIEAGIDGGGLTKEWADFAAKAIFSPSNGFFIVNEDQLVMPHPASYLATPDNHLKYFKAFGRLLGLIVYNRILVDAQFASTFLNALLGRVNQIDDLFVVDKSLYRSLVALKQMVASGSGSNPEEDPIAALGLCFEVTRALPPDGSNNSSSSTEELIPGGSREPVTRVNVRSYIHRYANYKVNLETAQQCRAFLSGFRELIEVEWLSMFSARELQLLISGEEKPIDVADMRRHVNYSGGYSDNHPFIEQFWDIVRNMTPHEQV